MRYLVGACFGLLCAWSACSPAGSLRQPVECKISIERNDPRIAEIVKNAIRHEAWVQQSIADRLLHENATHNEVAAEILKDSGWVPGDTFDLDFEPDSAKEPAAWQEWALRNGRMKRGVSAKRAQPVDRRTR